MRAYGKDRPSPLPVQALDHGTGYMLAAAAIRGIVQRVKTGLGCEIRGSLARTAELLFQSPTIEHDPRSLKPEDATDLDPKSEQTSWGPAHRVTSPVAIDGVAMHWDAPATALGSARARWTT
jgi:crotonobetainyl-CoA:carnitine CoA-transferase CaiB-like acyl-CoA transferase